MLEFAFFLGWTTALASKFSSAAKTEYGKYWARSVVLRATILLESNYRKVKQTVWYILLHFYNFISAFSGDQLRLQSNGLLLKAGVNIKSKEFKKYLDHCKEHYQCGVLITGAKISSWNTFQTDTIFVDAFLLWGWSCKKYMSHRFFRRESQNISTRIKNVRTIEQRFCELYKQNCCLIR